MCFVAAACRGVERGLPASIELESKSAERNFRRHHPRACIWTEDFLQADGFAPGELGLELAELSWLSGPHSVGSTLMAGDAMFLSRESLPISDLPRAVAERLAGRSADIAFRFDVFAEPELEFLPAAEEYFFLNARTETGWIELRLSNDGSVRSRESTRDEEEEEETPEESWSDAEQEIERAIERAILARWPEAQEIRSTPCYLYLPGDDATRLCARAVFRVGEQGHETLVHEDGRVLYDFRSVPRDAWPSDLQRRVLDAVTEDFEVLESGYGTAAARWRLQPLREPRTTFLVVVMSATSETQTWIARDGRRIREEIYESNSDD